MAYAARPPRRDQQSQVRFCEHLQRRDCDGHTSQDGGRNDQTEERSQRHLQKRGLQREPTEEIAWIVHASRSARRVLRNSRLGEGLEVVDISSTLMVPRWLWPDTVNNAPHAKVTPVGNAGRSGFEARYAACGAGLGNSFNPRAPGRNSSRRPWKRANSVRWAMLTIVVCFKRSINNSYNSD